MSQHENKFRATYKTWSVLMLVKDFGIGPVKLLLLSRLSFHNFVKRKIIKLQNECKHRCSKQKDTPKQHSELDMWYLWWTFFPLKIEGNRTFSSNQVSDMLLEKTYENMDFTTFESITSAMLPLIMYCLHTPVEDSISTEDFSNI